MLQTALAAAALVEGAVMTADGRQFLLKPDGAVWNDITDHDRRAPDRIKAAPEFDTRQGLTDYVNRHPGADSLGFADIDSGRVTAVLDYHLPDGGAGRCDHAPYLKLRESEEWNRWNGAQGRMMPQEEFAFFLEENSVDVTDPDQGRLLTIVKDLEAAKSGAFKSSIRLDNGDRAFRFEDETVASVEVPTRFTIEIPFYDGEDATALVALLKWKASPAGLTFGFVWHRVDMKRRAFFAQIAHRIAEDTGVTVLLGRFRKG
jgi:uncharacterized protein YfdQ (DUF2303 family)